jgi:hypothetical protein
MCNVLLLVVYPFVLLLLAIVLSVLRFTDSDYPFGTFRFFLTVVLIKKYPIGQDPFDVVYLFLLFLVRVNSGAAEGQAVTATLVEPVDIITNPVVSHERGKDRKVFTTSGIYMVHVHVYVVICDTDVP